MEIESRKAMLKSSTDEWRTPDSAFDYLHAIYDFTLDAAASTSNAKLSNYFTKEDDALQQDWTGRVWCNPPYSKGLQEQFFKKAVEEVVKGNADLVVMLVPARTDTKNFHDLIYPNASAIHFIRGRLYFSLPGVSSDAALFPSMLVIFERTPEGHQPEVKVIELPRK